MFIPVSSGQRITCNFFNRCYSLLLDLLQLLHLYEFLEIQAWWGPLQCLGTRQLRMALLSPLGQRKRGQCSQQGVKCLSNFQKVTPINFPHQSSCTIHSISTWPPMLYLSPLQNCLIFIHSCYKTILLFMLHLKDKLSKDLIKNTAPTVKRHCQQNSCTKNSKVILC